MSDAANCSIKEDRDISTSKGDAARKRFVFSRARTGAARVYCGATRWPTPPFASILGG